MGKTTYKVQTGLVEQLMLAMSAASASSQVDASFDFLVAGTPQDTRREFEVSHAEPK